MTEPLWRDLTHQQVWEQVHAGPGPYASDGAATAWSNAQAALRQIDSDLGAAITKAAGWTGPAANATRSGLTPLGGWAVDATGSAGRAASSLTEHQEQVAWVRANLPEPSPAAALEPPVPLSDAGVDPAVLQNWTVTVGRNTALADQAFHVMDTYAANTALIQQQVPTWTPPPAVTMSVADRPAGSAMAVAGGRVDRVATAVATPATRGPTPAPSPPPPTATPSSAGAAAAAARGGAAGASAAGNTAAGSGIPTELGVVGGLPAGPGVVGILPAEPGALGGLPDGIVPAEGVAPTVPPGRPNTAPPNPAPPGSGRTTPGVLRGLPGGDGVLRGSPSTPLGPPLGQGSSPLGLPPRPGPGGSGGGGGGGDGGADGGARLGGRPETGAGVLGGRPSNTGSTIRAEPAASGAGRSAAERSPGYLPMGGAGLGSRSDTYRRPDYLVDNWGFFVDDRHIQGPLITPELDQRPREASIS